MTDTSTTAAATAPIAPARVTSPFGDDDFAIYHATKLPDTFAMKWVIPNLGLIVGALTLPLFFVGTLPMAGWLLAAGLWLLNRMGHGLVGRYIDGMPKVLAVGAAGMTMMLRVWTIALILFFFGAELQLGEGTLGAGRPDIAVPAMLLFLIMFTFDVGARALTELYRYKVADAANPAPAVATAEAQEHA